MTVHLLKNFGNRIETEEMDEGDMGESLLAIYEGMEKSMKKNGCKAIVVKLESGFKIMYEMPESN